jgi:hypothetical protein
LDADFTPLMRRLAQCLLALCLIADTTAAYVWGNQIVFRNRASVSVGSFQLFLDSQVTSCILSQAVIALHFVYVSLRSRHGRGWAYAPLRFELDESGKASFFRSNTPQMMRQGLNESTSAELESGAACEDLRSKSEATISRGPLTGLRQRLVRFQKRRESQCRVFVIPCVARLDEGTGGCDAEFGLARPAFDMRWLRPLQRLADANTKRYVSILVGCFGLPSLVCSIVLNGEARGIVCLILNSAALIMVLGFFSSKQYNLDKEAVKHVALSFRFAIIAALLVFWIFLTTRRAYVVATGGNVYVYKTTFWDPSFVVVFCASLLFIMLFDCIPQLPAFAQTLMTVRACSLVLCRYSLLFPVHFIVMFRLLDSSTSKTPIFRRRSRLLHSFGSFFTVRRQPIPFDLQHSVPVAGAGADFPRTRARHEHLRERVGEALAFSAKFHHVCVRHTSHPAGLRRQLRHRLYGIRVVTMHDVAWQSGSLHLMSRPFCVIRLLSKMQR